MPHRLLLPVLITILLASCDEDIQVISPEGYVTGSTELDGTVHAVPDKSLYRTMKAAVQTRDPSTLVFPDETGPWFTLAGGDRIRLIEVDEDEAIAQVEVLSGLHTGITCWISVDCVVLDDGTDD